VVAHSRAPLRAHQLRPLNEPKPVSVTCGATGAPLWVGYEGRTRRVARVIDSWRLDDEWWREPLSRLYYRVEYDDGVCQTLYCDLIHNAWYRQRDHYVR